MEITIRNHLASEEENNALEFEFSLEEQQGEESSIVTFQGLGVYLL